jgi:hypothetical protein
VGDERVTDIQGVEVGKGEEIREIGEAKAVAGVDSDLEMVGLFGGGF